MQVPTYCYSDMRLPPLKRAASVPASKRPEKPEFWRFPDPRSKFFKKGLAVVHLQHEGELSNLHARWHSRVEQQWNSKLRYFPSLFYTFRCTKPAAEVRDICKQTGGDAVVLTDLEDGKVNLTKMRRVDFLLNRELAREGLGEEETEEGSFWGREVSESDAATREESAISRATGETVLDMVRMFKGEKSISNEAIDGPILAAEVGWEKLSGGENFLDTNKAILM